MNIVLTIHELREVIAALARVLDDDEYKKDESSEVQVLHQVYKKLRAQYNGGNV